MCSYQCHPYSRFSAHGAQSIGRATNTDAHSAAATRFRSQRARVTGTAQTQWWDQETGEAISIARIGLIAVMVLFVTMVYGPIAAFLVELFPTRIRYTSMSLPYHIGNGVFGGLVPFIATLVTTLPGANHLSGLWYPIGIAFLSFVIGILYIRKSSAIKY